MGTVALAGEIADVLAAIAAYALVAFGMLRGLMRGHRRNAAIPTRGVKALTVAALWPIFWPAFGPRRAALTFIQESTRAFARAAIRALSIVSEALPPRNRLADAADAARFLVHVMSDAAPRLPVAHGRFGAASVYAAQGTTRAYLVLAPGMLPWNRPGPHVAHFTRALTRVGFTIVVPQIPSATIRHVSAEDAAQIAETLRRLAMNGERGATIGVAAISSAVVPAIVAVLSPDLAKRVDFICTLGGCASGYSVLAFATTGCWRQEGELAWRRLQPPENLRWIVLASLSHVLEDERDRSILCSVAETKLRGSTEAFPHLVDRLGVQGRAVVALMNNADPDRVPALVAALPQSVREAIGALDLTEMNVAAMRGRFHVVHYRGDCVQPCNGSVTLARLLPRRRTKLVLLNGGGHADLRENAPANMLRLCRLAYDVMRERAPVQPALQGVSAS